MVRAHITEILNQASVSLDCQIPMTCDLCCWRLQQRSPSSYNSCVPAERHSQLNLECLIKEKNVLYIIVLSATFSKFEGLKL